MRVSDFLRSGVSDRDEIFITWTEVKNHFAAICTEVKIATSTQVVSKSKITSTQLAEKSEFNFYTDCAEVKSAKKQGTTFFRLVPLA